MEIATLILPWCRDGNYGCLFDGTSNHPLTGKIAHFELGYIPESAKELKATTGFLITKLTAAFENRGCACTKFCDLTNRVPSQCGEIASYPKEARGSWKANALRVE